MLAHAIDVWHHDPVVSVDEQLHEPLVNGIGSDVTEQHEVPKNHQSFNVMAIGVL